MFDMTGLRRTHRLTGADDACQVHETALCDKVPLQLMNRTIVVDRRRIRSISDSRR
jgi:hypothetical protein